MSTEEFVESGDTLGDSVYEDEQFDEYSDSFESGDGGEDDGSESHTALDDHNDEEGDENRKGARDLQNANSCRYESGDFVQVFWTDEREWFGGHVAQIDTLSGRCFIQYDDGEEAWETVERMRYAPGAFERASEAFQQLQLLMLPDATQSDKVAVLVRLHGANVLVYWRDSSSWFPGSIARVDSEVCALQIEYDDGDLRWEPECDFFNILVRASADTTACPETNAISSALHAAPPRSDLAATESEIERIIIPRAYKTMISDHFQPERTPRSYTSVTNTIGSVLTARSVRYSERRYLHNKTKLECTASNGNSAVSTTSTTTTAMEIISRDCLVQTDIVVAGEWMKNGDLPNQVQHFSQCG